MIALSFGLLASNSSATLGKPPVISFVLEVSFGNLANTSPADIFCPSFTEKLYLELNNILLHFRQLL